jgi:hypothetical protein
MAIELAKLVVNLRADVSDLRKDLDKAQKQIKQSGKKSANVFKSVLSAGLVQQGITRGLAAVNSLMSDSIALAQRQEAAETKLAATIRATGGAVGFTAEELKQYAANLQSVTTFGDEEIIESMSLMTTFNKITGDTFKRATEAATDLSAAGFGQLRQVTVQLSKALQDPVKGMNAMAKSGVSFDAATQNLIKSLVEQNKILEAQELILEAVEGQVEGVARALAKTDAGRIKQINNDFGDMKELIGKELMGAILDIKSGILAFFQQVEAGMPVLIQMLRVFREMVSLRLGRDLARIMMGTTAIGFRAMTGRPLGGSDTNEALLVMEGIKAMRDQMNALSVEDVPIVPTPNIQAQLGGDGAGTFAGALGIPELAKTIQQQVLGDKQDTMITLLEETKAIQEQQLGVMEDSLDVTENGFVPARLAKQLL